MEMLIRHIINLSHLKYLKGHGRIESSYQLVIVHVRYGKGGGRNVNLKKVGVVFVYNNTDAKCMQR